LISHKHRFIFIHPAKTGGTSIEKALEPFCEEKIVYDMPTCHWFAMYNKDRNTKHHSFAMYQSFLHDYDLSEYKVIYTTRNPWDRVLSMWAYEKSRNDVGLRCQVDVESFRKFVKMYYKDFIYGNMNIVHLIDGCNVDMSFLIRFESLQYYFDKACEFVGLPKIELPRLVESSHNDRSFYYDEETRKIVEGLFAADIKHFGYVF